MKIMHYAGLDVHKKMIAYCVKTPRGRLVEEGEVAATREALGEWVERFRKPLGVAMEATLFTGWIFDFFCERAAEVKVAHPQMLKAIACSKKKNDRLDAEKICDLYRMDMLPECYMMPGELRELRTTLRFRNLLVRTATQYKNKCAGLLMEAGAQYEKKRLHGKRYFAELMETVEDVPESVKFMSRQCHEIVHSFNALQRQMITTLNKYPDIRERLDLLRTIPGVGEILALTWSLEIGDPHRFGSGRKVISYIGLCSEQRESAGKSWRGPLSKKRNKHLQTKLIEVAKLAPSWNEELAAVHARAAAKGNANRATLEVARHLARLLLAVDKSGQPYEPDRWRKTKKAFSQEAGAARPHTPRARARA